MTEIVEYNETEASLTLLRENYKDAKYEVAKTEGMAAAKSARMQLRTVRVALEAKRKEIKEPALTRCKLIDSEAKRITEELERLLSIGSETVTVVDSEVQRCQRLRQSILKWAFEGKLVDQDPNDEPASVLLERIRAEREQQAAEKGKKGRARRKNT